MRHAMIKTRALITTLALLCLLPWTASAQKLDQTEQHIIHAVDTGLARATKDLETSVNINSGTMNFDGVKAVGKHYQQLLAELGFDVTLTDGSSFDRAGHLVASYGHKGPKILMIGHLDTVFAKDDAFQKFTPLDNDMVAGPGITDMKGGNMIIIAVARALKEAGVLDQVSLRIVMTGDEERSGKPLSASKKAVIEGGKWADIALGFEDGDSNIKTAVVSRRGSVDWHLDVTGTPAHSSQIFQPNVGYGAVFEAARILNAFREKLSTETNLTFNPGLILGGTRTTLDPQTASGMAFGKNNVIAKTLQVSGGIRAVSPEQLAMAQKVMQDITNQHLVGTSATLTFGEGYPPMAPTEGNHKLLANYSQVSEDLGFGAVTAVNPRNAGAADISFAADYVDMALDGLGLMGSGGHTKDEIADMTSYHKNIKKAAVLIYRLSK